MSDEISYVIRVFFTSVSLTSNWPRSPACGTPCQLLPSAEFWLHWSHWQTLGWRYQGHDAQLCWGMYRNHSDITSPPHSDHVPMSHTQPKNPSAWFKSWVIQVFQNNRSGKAQLLASNSNTPKHHKSRYFYHLFGFQDGIENIFQSGIQAMEVFLTIKLLRVNNLTVIILISKLFYILNIYIA